MDLLKEVLTHACLDSLRMLPFLFVALLLMEGLAHSAGKFSGKTVKRMAKAGPAVGALTGSIPQCGFSVAAASLYAGGYLSRGTLLAVFVAASDEALLIILANPGHIRLAVLLLTVKIVIGAIAGYAVDRFLPVPLHAQERLQQTALPACPCNRPFFSMLQAAGTHTAKLFFFLFLFTAAIYLTLELIGDEKLSALLMNDTFLQPVICAAVGLIPNCVPSVLLTQLYLEEMLSFASLLAGLCSNAGLGLLTLFKVNPHQKENIRFITILYLTSVLSGILLMVLLKILS